MLMKTSENLVLFTFCGQGVSTTDGHHKKKNHEKQNKNKTTSELTRRRVFRFGQEARFVVRVVKIMYRTQKAGNIINRSISTSYIDKIEKLYWGKSSV